MSARPIAPSKKAAQLFSAPEAVVIGDGWGALATVGFLVQNLREKALITGTSPEHGIVWVAGSGTHMLAALPGMETGPGVELWSRLARGFGIETGAAATGSYLREFRNKSFRSPAWAKAPTPEARKEVIEESLWNAERRLVPLLETRFELTVNELEARIRAFVTGDSEESAPWRALIRRIEGLPAAGFAAEEGSVRSVTLASGEQINCSQVYYADRWADLPGMTGLPKDLAFIRRREPTSLLQAHFLHSQPVGEGVKEGFFGSVHKESGEDFERHLWGHFSSDGLQSFWSLCITSDEVEDNHQIAKKLRRLKNGLDKMFAGSSWVPQGDGSSEFMNNVRAESVRFLETVLYAEGEEPVAPVTLKQMAGLRLITDGYGPSSALQQVGLALGLPAELAGPDSEAENVDLGGPAAS